MSSSVQTPEPTSPETAVTTDVSTGWLGAVGAGLAAGVAMAAVMAIWAPAALSTAIPSLYGSEGALVGVTAHLAHSAIFGVLFAAIVRYANLGRYVDGIVPSTGLGLAYGIVLWVLAASFLMPAWMSALGMAATVPTFDLTSLGAHAVYGAILGALYPYLKGY
jgi:hypothetical protein